MFLGTKIKREAKKKVLEKRKGKKGNIINQTINKS